VVSELFFVDPLQGIRVSYEQLQRDVAAVKLTQPVIAFEETYDLFCKLLAAVERQSTVILVDQAADRAVAEGLLQPQEFAGVAASGNRSTTTHSLDSPSFLTGDNRCRIGLFTSGTTGQPKLVCHGLKSLTRTVRVSEKHRNDVWGLAYHPAHFAGLQVFFQALANRNTIVRLFGLEPSQIHTSIELEGITHLSSTPTLMKLLVSTGQDHRHVQSVTLGGERTAANLLEQLSVVFPNAQIRNVYASTEVGSVLISDGEYFSVPVAYHGLIKVIDGELAVHRSLLAASLQEISENDFHMTGDCVDVVQNEPLSFRFVSRNCDLINVGGYKVNPHEVESHLIDMPEVSAAAVYGRANSVTGNLVCCDLVLRAGQSLTTREIFTRLQSKLPTYKIPRIVQIVPSLGLTSTGKTKRGA